MIIPPARVVRRARPPDLGGTVPPVEQLLDHGEALLVPERLIVAPAAGVFRTSGVHIGDIVEAGSTIGYLDGPGTSAAVASPFTGLIQGMLAAPGERLREGQPVAWLRTT